jgi:hypothetical protein
MNTAGRRRIVLSMAQQQEFVAVYVLATRPTSCYVMGLVTCTSRQMTLARPKEPDLKLLSVLQAHWVGAYEC